jgi:hypothetical protein
MLAIRYPIAIGIPRGGYAYSPEQHAPIEANLRPERDNGTKKAF